MRMIRYAFFWMIAAGLAAVITGLQLKPEPPGNIYYQDQAAVLLYHDIRTEVPPGAAGSSTISTAQLREHLKMLGDRGFRIVTMDEFAGFMLQGKKLPANAVVLTFDDGYETFYREAAPILQEFHATASNFIVGASSDVFQPEAEPHLSWEQMNRLKAQGIGFYSHTYNLHRMLPSGRSGALQPALTARILMTQAGRNESEDQHRLRIYSDIAFMEKRLRQELGSQRRLLAFPYGAYDDAVLEEGGRAGIELFFTIEEGLNTAGTRIVKRINAGEPYMTADALWEHLQSFFAKKQ
ncbi:polysaccharide deacetylase family protein [Paenibacillus doosanensis]|uniref:polysaccharide deacetylase family protein n=1 Tax=Paenibacillus doosanensis TaxID=1229154 RepID=UPI00217F8D57|nr:polysaccharide deacetylase family protein [Paenibacillus doosanensis]